MCKIVGNAEDSTVLPLISELLIKHEALFQNTVFNLIQLIEHLGSYSITSRQTLAFMEMLRQDSTTHQHLVRIFLFSKILMPKFSF